MDAIRAVNAVVVRTPVVSLQNSSDPLGCRLSLRFETASDWDDLSIPHDDVFDEAERRGLTRDLALATVEYACRLSREAPADRGIYFIRVPLATLSDAQFQADLERTINARNMDRSRLCLEIPESIFGVSFTYEGLQQLADKGYPLSLGNFGTVMSSFEWLLRFPVAYLRIAPQFVIGIVSDPISRELVLASNELGKIRSLRTIAGGADTPECTMLLRALGVDYVELNPGCVPH